MKDEAIEEDEEQIRFFLEERAWSHPIYMNLVPQKLVKDDAIN